MKNSSKTLQVFIDTIRIETQTEYRENGEINIYRCPFEKNPMMVVDGEYASQKGRMVTQDNGTSFFHPYAVDSGSRYHLLFGNAHGEVKETSKQIIFILRFPKRLGKGLIMSLLRMEQDEQWAFFKSLRLNNGRKGLVGKKSTK